MQRIDRKYTHEPEAKTSRRHESNFYENIKSLLRTATTCALLAGATAMAQEGTVNSVQKTTPPAGSSTSEPTKMVNPLLHLNKGPMSMGLAAFGHMENGKPKSVIAKEVDGFARIKSIKTAKVKDGTRPTSTLQLNAPLIVMHRGEKELHELWLQNVAVIDSQNKEVLFIDNVFDLDESEETFKDRVKTLRTDPDKGLYAAGTDLKPTYLYIPGLYDAIKYRLPLDIDLIISLDKSKENKNNTVVSFGYTVYEGSDKGKKGEHKPVFYDRLEIKDSNAIIYASPYYKGYTYYDVGLVFGGSPPFTLHYDTRNVTFKSFNAELRLIYFDTKGEPGQFDALNTTDTNTGEGATNLSMRLAPSKKNFYNLKIGKINPESNFEVAKPASSQ